MSGGVDSSVTAAILKERYCQIIGITMLLHPGQDKDVVESAKKIADKLNIPIHTVDFSKLFEQRVITPFCNEYRQGRTPNPCIYCNNHIKFDVLLEGAKQLGADFLATGHYARVINSTNGYQLLKGVDQSKDQSYFLYKLGQQQLENLLFPLGFLFKWQTKKIANKLGLTNSVRPESQDVCFIPDGNYSSFVTKFAQPTPGDIIDTDGKILGKHKGLPCYTIGQRQGLGLTSDRRLYVIRLDTEKNMVIVGGQEHLLADNLTANQLSWVSGQPPLEEINDITARIRYRSPEIEVSLDINQGNAEVQLKQPQQAVAPGQSIVFYRGDFVLGGGVIESYR